MSESIIELLILAITGVISITLLIVYGITIHSRIYNRSDILVEPVKKQPIKSTKKKK